MKTTVKTSCFALALVALNASAGTWYFNGDVYLDEGTSDRAVSTVAKWKDADGNVATAFNASDTYVVRNNGRMRLASGDVFAGGPLYFGDTSYGGNQAGRLRTNLGKSTFSQGLHFTKGSLQVSIQRSDDDTMRDAMIISSRIDVEASTSSPFQLICRADSGTDKYYNHRRLLLDAPLHSGSGAGLQVGGSGGSDFSVALLQDCSGYLGQIDVKPDRSDVAFGEWDTCLMLGDITVGGSVRVFAGSAIEARTGVYYGSSGVSYTTGSPTECTVGSLELRANSAILVWGKTSTPTNGIIHVRDALSVTAPVAVKIKYDPRTASTNKVTILTAPASSALDAADFTLGFDTANYMSDYSLAVESDGVTKSLVAVFEPTVWQVSNYGNEYAKDQATGASSLTNSAAWSDNLVPSDTHAPSAYYVGKDRYLRTLVNDNDFDFPCRSFTLDGGRLIVFTKSFRVPEFRAQNNASIFLGQGNGKVKTIKADRFVANSGTVNFAAYANQTMIVDAEITGDATILVQDTGGTSSPRGHYLLTGLNTNFTGNITVSQSQKQGGNWTFEDKFQTLYVNDGRNLGGAKEAFGPKALLIKDMGRVSVTNGTVTLESGLNRGIYVDGLGVEPGNPGGRLFTDADSTLVVNWPVTLNGKLMKEGAGTLVLGGGALFDGGAPKANSNLFEVAAGTLVVASHSALDGMETTFDNGTSLTLKVDPANADLMKYGILNAKTETPFTLGAGLSKLPLTLDTTAFPDITEKRRAFGLVTVTNTAAAAVRALMPTGKFCPDVHNMIVERENAGEGTVTFELQLERLGLTVIIR